MREMRGRRDRHGMGEMGGMRGMHGDYRRKAPLGMVAVVVWSLAWKAASLWRAAKDDSKPWFATLFVVNSAGILDALYIFFISPHRKKEHVEIIDDAEYTRQTDAYQTHPDET